MRTFNIFILIAFLIGINSHISLAASYTSNATGAWSSSSSWTGSAPPVTSISGHTISITSPYTITRTGDLDFDGGSASTISVASGATLRINGDITVNDTGDSGITFDIDGTLIINGTIDALDKDAVVIFKGSGSIRINDDVSFVTKSELYIYESAVVNIDGDMTGASGGGESTDLDGTGTFNLSGTYSGFDEAGDSNITWNTNQPLPVDLHYFKAKIKNNHIELLWETLTETNNDYFTIERSEDGLNFLGIGTMKGSGTTKDAQQYTFLNAGAPSGQVYYRLKQTDFDGTTETFKIIAVNNIPQTSAAVLYPNPLKSGDLKISFGSNQPNAIILIEVVDQSGRQVLQKTIESSAFAAVQIDADEVELLQRGMYIVRLQNGSDSYVSRFMKL